VTNYYTVLCIPQNASREQIVASFRTLAMQYHPDRNSAPDSMARFIEVYEAYEILIDFQKRATYDRILASELAAAHSAARTQTEYSDARRQSDSYSQWSEEARSHAERDSSIKYAEFVSKILRTTAEIIGTVAVSTAVGVGVGIVSTGLKLLVIAAAFVPIVSIIASYYFGVGLFIFNLALGVGWYVYLANKFKIVPGSPSSKKQSGRVTKLLQSKIVFASALIAYMIVATLTVNGLFSKMATESKQRKVAFEQSISDLRDHIPKYLVEYPIGETIAHPTFLPKIVIVDMDKGDFHTSFYNLPSDLGARNDAEINQIIQVKKKKKLFGKYTDGSDAYQWICDYRLIDYKKGKAIFQETLEGTEPPRSKRSGGAAYGSDPFDKVIQAIRSAASSESSN